jgi:hypothetical protein
MSTLFRMRNTACAAALGLLLSACGGGGGDGSSSPPPVTPPSLTITPNTVSVTATTADPAPTASITATVAPDSSQQQYYFFAQFSGNGIASVTSTGGTNTATFAIHFRVPSDVNPGTYTDTVTIQGCPVNNCNTQVENSPLQINVKYVVGQAPVPGAPVTITSIGPSAVVAGGGGFMMYVSGSNFVPTSIVQLNGSARTTTFQSSTLLTADIAASDIAAAGTATITVVDGAAGGGAASNAATLTVGTTVPATFSVSTSSLSAATNTSTGGGSIFNNPFALGVNGPAAGTFYYSISFNGTAVSSMNVNGETGITPLATTPSGPSANRITGFVSPGGGQTIKGTFSGPITEVTQLILLNAATLGAGTYTDTISVSVCLDAQCLQPLPGSPQQVAVNYVVAGNPISNAQFSLGNSSLTVEAATSSGASPTATAVLSSSGLPPYGAYVNASIGNGAAVSATSFQSNLDGSGTLTVTLKPPSGLGSGIYGDSVQLQVCFDLACTKPANHGQFTLPVRYIVDASPGVDFTMTTIAGQTSSLVWNAAKQRIYAIVPSFATANPGSLLVINPASATIDSVLSLGSGNDPIFLAVSDDGQFAYIAEDIPNQIVRVNLATLTIDETLSLPIGDSCVGIAVAPAAAHTLAAALYNNMTTLVVFDDTVQRQQVFSPPSLEAQVPFTWGADATSLFAYDEVAPTGTMYQLLVQTTGLSVAQQTSNVGLAPNDGLAPSVVGLQFVGGLIYADRGTVFNPATNGTLTPFTMQSSNEPVAVSESFVADTTLNRAFALTNDQPVGLGFGDITVEGFNLTTQQPTWITRFAAPQGGGPMVRWGTNGLAFPENTADNFQIVLINGPVVSR